MQDLSDGSHLLWNHIQPQYTKLSPLQKTTFEATQDDELRKNKCVRVDRRQSPAVPQGSTASAWSSSPSAPSASAPFPRSLVVQDGVQL